MTQSFFVWVVIPKQFEGNDYDDEKSDWLFWDRTGHHISTKNNQIYNSFTKHTKTTISS